ncbi:MAG: MFS transporter [Desulfocucumaceae bacterium]
MKNIRAVSVLFVILFLIMVGFGIVIPVLPYFVVHLGGGPTALGIFMASYSLMQFFFAPLWGRLSDRIGRRPVLLIGLAGYGITFILFGFASQLWMMFAIRILSGILSSAALPTAMAYMADITDGEERSKGMGIMGAAMGLGMIFGPALGGWLGQYNFSLPFFAAGGLAVLNLPFTLAFLPESHKEKGVQSAQVKPGITLEVIRNPLFFLFFLGFIINFSMALFEGTFALYAADKAGFGTRELGTLFAILGVFGVVVQGGLLGRLSKKYGDAAVIKTGVFISSAGMLLILLSSDRGILYFTTVIFNVGISLLGPSSSSLVTKKTTGGQGASLGLMQSFGSLGRILGPVVGGALYAFNLNAPYALGSVVHLQLGVLAVKKLPQYAKETS